MHPHAPEGNRYADCHQVTLLQMNCTPKSCESHKETDHQEGEATARELAPGENRAGQRPRCRRAWPGTSMDDTLFSALEATRLAWCLPD